jgi:hypothetical protein
MKIVDEFSRKGSHKPKYVLLATVGDARSRWCYSSSVRAKSAKSAFMKSWYHSYIPHSCVLVDIESQQDKDFLVHMNGDIPF